MLEKKIQKFFFFLFLWISPTLLISHEYNLAVCTIFKDNAEYFKEWIEFHKLVGVEHFYLYDNSSADNSREVLKPYIAQGIVTLIDWPNQHEESWGDLECAWVRTTQETAYNHCGELALGKAKWVAVIDVDEFIVPDAFPTIPEYLDHYKNTPAILVRWREYGTSGIYDIPSDRLLIELLDKRCPDDHPRNQSGKIIYQPESLVEFIFAGHRCKCKGNALTYAANPKEIRINHYVNRTISFFLDKKRQQKQTMDNLTFSEEEWQSQLNHGNEIEDRIMDRFIPALQKKMGFSSVEPASKSIVTCELIGQLGNQLFEIAATLAYAWDHDATPLFPDLNHSHSHLSENRDKIFFRLNTPSEPLPIKNSFHESNWYSSEKIPFQEDLKLFGYFQSWKHFHHHREKLLEVLAPPQTTLDYLHSKYGDLIRNDKTVSVHVRTFNKNLSNSKIHPFLGLDYYREAIRHFPQDSIFVVFSDRINWCKNKFQELDAQFVFIEDNDAIQDFFLYSLMRNHIISNSTFSWWGAYMNKNPDKIVVAPQHWMHPDYFSFPPTQPNDFYFPDWIMASVNLNQPYPEDMTWYDTSTKSLDGN